MVSRLHDKTLWGDGDVPRLVVKTEVLGQISSQAGRRRRALKVLDIEIVTRVLVELLAETEGPVARGSREVSVGMGSEDVPVAAPARDWHWALQSRQWRRSLHLVDSAACEGSVGRYVKARTRSKAKPLLNGYTVTKRVEGRDKSHSKLML